MRNNNPLRCRQQWPLFPSESLWQKLPEQTQQRCRELVVQLLRTVVHHEQEERSQDERQD
jgi:hypothetical protein